MSTEISRIICFGLLFVVSLADIKDREISSTVLGMGTLAAVVYQIVFCKEKVAVMMGGIVVGMLFFLVSKVTKEGIGYGDSFGILGLGIYLGIWNLIEVLVITFFFLSMGAILALCLSKMSRKSALPFYPFLTTGYLIWNIVG